MDINVCLLPNKVPKFGVCRGDIKKLPTWQFEGIENINSNEERFERATF
jgi:hypothetical protein